MRCFWPLLGLILAAAFVWPTSGEEDVEGAVLAVLAPSGVVMKDVFNFSDPLSLVLRTAASCDAGTIQVHLDGVLITPFLKASSPPQVRLPGLEGEGADEAVLEYQIDKVPPQGAVMEGFHALHVSVQCDAVQGKEGGRQAHFVAEATFELEHVRRPFDLADAAHGMEECLTNSTLVPAGLGHVFDAELHARVRRLATEERLPNVNHGDLILDVGGNVGVNTQRLLDQFPHAQLHVFEPLPALATALEERFRGNARVRVHHFGLGRQGSSPRVAVAGACWLSRSCNLAAIRHCIPNTKKTVGQRC